MQQTVQGEPSWRLSHDLVELFVTRTGGQMAPVHFDLGDGASASPYALAPWQPASCEPGTPAVLRVLRGDFFCLPFGASELTPHPHGATANLDWECDSQQPDALLLSLEDPVTGARIVKDVRLREGQRAVYLKHRISGLEGQFNFGHHPILEFPPQAGSCAIRTGAIKFGQVYPGPLEDPALGGYSCLQPGARFTSLERVPLANGGTTSLAEYPAREGFEDIIMYSNADAEFGWVAVHFPGYAWLAIKNAAELPSTLLWHSNGGRHYAPWNGRHRRRLGIEDVCSYFHEGAESSARDRLRNEGIETSRRFQRGQSWDVHHIQLVHPLPAGFGTIETVLRDPDGGALWLANAADERLQVAVDWQFLFGRSGT